MTPITDLNHFEIDAVGLVVINVLEVFFLADVDELRVVVNFSIDLPRRFLQTTEQRLDQFVTDVPDLERAVDMRSGGAGSN